MEIKTTKEDLVKAFKLWNAEMIDSPEDFDEPELGNEFAERQVDEFLIYLKRVNVPSDI